MKNAESVIPEVEVKQEIEAWRAQQVRLIVRASVILAAIVAAVAVYQAVTEGDYTQAVFRGVIYGVVLLAAFWPKLPHRTQISAIIGLFALVGSYNSYLFGINGESSLFLFGSWVLAALYLERRGSMVMTFFVMGLIAVLGWGFSSGVIVPVRSYIFNDHWQSWVLYGAIFLLIGAVVLYSQNALMVRLTKALKESRILALTLQGERAGLEDQVAERTRTADAARQEAEKATVQLQDQLWLVTGHALLSDVLREELEISVLADRAIRQVCHYMEIEVGALYLREGDGMRLTGRYAYTPEPTHPLCFAVGEGIVGQVMVDQQMRQLDNLESTQFTIASGLGYTRPRFILAAPFFQGGEVCGVVELGALKEFTPLKKKFVEGMLEDLSIAFNVAENRARIRQLLEETRRQAEELQAQEEELRATNEELEAQTESLREHISRVVGGAKGE